MSFVKSISHKAWKVTLKFILQKYQISFDTFLMTGVYVMHTTLSWPSATKANVSFFRIMPLCQNIFSGQYLKQNWRILQRNFIQSYRALRRSAVRMIHNSYFHIFRFFPFVKISFPTIFQKVLNRALRRSAVHMVYNSYFLIYRVRSKFLLCFRNSESGHNVDSGCGCKLIKW